MNEPSISVICEHNISLDALDIEAVIFGGAAISLTRKTVIYREYGSNILCLKEGAAYVIEIAAPSLAGQH